MTNAIGNGYKKKAAHFCWPFSTWLLFLSFRHVFPHKCNFIFIGRSQICVPLLLMFMFMHLNGTVTTAVREARKTRKIWQVKSGLQAAGVCQLSDLWPHKRKLTHPDPGTISKSNWA